MKLLISVYLRESGYMYDPSAFETLTIQFKGCTREGREEFSEAARAMPTDKYSRTVYWGIIRGWLLSGRGHYRPPGCPRCGRDYPGLVMQVHHRSYAHKGSEYAHLEELEVLCAGCHVDRHIDATYLARGLGCGHSRPEALNTVDGSSYQIIPFSDKTLEKILSARAQERSRE